MSSRRIHGPAKPWRSEPYRLTAKQRTAADREAEIRRLASTEPGYDPEGLDLDLQSLIRRDRDNSADER